MEENREIRMHARYTCHVCVTNFEQLADLGRHLKEVEKLKFTSNLQGKKKKRKEGGKIIKWIEDEDSADGVRFLCAACYQMHNTLDDLSLHFQQLHIESTGMSSRDVLTGDDAAVWSSEQETEEYFERIYAPELEGEEGVLVGGNDLMPIITEDSLYEHVYGLIAEYRMKIDQNRKLLQHAPTRDVLSSHFQQLQNHFADHINYKRYEVTKREEDLLLGVSHAFNDEVEKSLVMIDIICGLRGENIRKTASERTHLLENFVIWVAAIEPKSPYWTSEWVDKSLPTSAARRNEQADQQIQSKIGQKCDYLLRYDAIGLQPEMLIGEISGGLPAAANWKSWHDFMKLVLISRDCLARLGAIGAISQSKEDHLVVYAFQLHGRVFKLYAVDQWRDLWRVALVDECFLPVSRVDLQNRVVMYSAIKGMFAAVMQQAEVAARITTSYL
ncbi:hypothetical protein NQZ79_g3999 [Umbelopsis isabellina]|nr:hypothetical protein NQZ79_g3999 [Umbelopsis isabellina]